MLWVKKVYTKRFRQDRLTLKPRQVAFNKSPFIIDTEGVPCVIHISFGPFDRNSKRDFILLYVRVTRTNLQLRVVCNQTNQVKDQTTKKRVT